MANEITITMRIKVEKGALRDDKNAGTFSVDLSDYPKAGNVQTIGTAHEALVVSTDVATAGWAYFRNLDTANYVEVGTLDGTTFESFGKLLAEEPALMPLATTAIYAKANTAPVDLDYMILHR